MSDEFLKKSVNKKSAYIFGGLFGVVVSLIVMLIFSAALLLFNIDRAYATPFATISVGIGSFFASQITAKKIGDKGYIIGLIIGLVVFFLITLLSLILGNGLSLNTLFHFIIIMLSSLAGGITGVNSGKTKKYI